MSEKQVEFRKLMESPAIALRAKEISESALTQLQSAPLEDRLRQLRLMPSYHQHLLQAKSEIDPLHSKIAQQENAKRKGKIYRIGPPIIDPRTSKIISRIQRTISGYIEEYVRGYPQHVRSIKSTWKDLQRTLEQVASGPVHFRESKKNRQDAYEFSIEGDYHTIAYTSFERIFRKAMKPVSVIG